jgi:hypothetical protein
VGKPALKLRVSAKDPSPPLSVMEELSVFGTLIPGTTLAVSSVLMESNVVTVMVLRRYDENTHWL